MFVRWKKRHVPERKHKYAHKAYTLLSAVLVESKRVEGKVKQKLIRHLGSIQDVKIQYPNIRKGFWERVDSRLAEVDLDMNKRDSIVAVIEKTVPRPSLEETNYTEQR